MKTAGICLIGAGRAGMIHARNFIHAVPGAKLLAVADPVQTACEKACEELGIQRYYLDHKIALAQPDIDAVIVVAPTKYHRDIVVDAARAHKHILCEKPMAMNEKECDDMIAVVEEHGVKLLLGFMRRFDENFIAAKQAIIDGEIGQIVQIRSITRGPSKPQEWMYDIEKSNGPLAEVNSHDIDCVRWLAESDWDHVYAIAGNYRNLEVKEQWPDFYDNVVLTGKFKNGILFTIEGAQYVQYGYDARVEILGTEGVIHVGRQDAYHYKSINKQQGTHTPFISSWTSLFKDAYLAEDMHFIDCILHDKQPMVTGVDGKIAVKVVNAGNKSIKSHKIIPL